MNSRPLRVLVACERSQVVTSAFLARGCVAYSLDVEPCYGPLPERHIIGDAYTFPLSGWDLIVAHPPCTYLSNINSGNHDSLVRLIDTIHALRLWYRFFHEAPCPVAVENPVGLVNSVCPPTQIIQPWHFGDPYQKTTCLWLRGIPPLMHTIECLTRTPWVGGGRKLGVAQLVTGLDRSTARSKTFPGIADAMADQWTAYLLSKRSGNPCKEMSTPSTPVCGGPMVFKDKKSMVDGFCEAESENKVEIDNVSNEPRSQFDGSTSPVVKNARPVKRFSHFHGGRK